MAVQGWILGNKEMTMQKEHDNFEASKLMDFRNMGNRMSQLDDILKRKAEAALFTMDEYSIHGKDGEDNAAESSKAEERNEKIVKELLKKVKKRRKLVRSYLNFAWFSVFFACFIGNLYIKAQQNEHLFSVDESIKNRIVDILPKGNIGNNSQFYEWIDQVVIDVFEDSVCGNGVCEPPLEYPGLGRFGCAADCGLHPQRTSLRIDVQAAWDAGIPGLNLSDFAAAAAADPPVRYAYNIYSETLGAYLLAADATQASVTVDVPDGNLRLDLYQLGPPLSLAVPSRHLAAYAGVAPGTVPPPRKRFDFQYGDPAEAAAAAAAAGRRVQAYCAGDPSLEARADRALPCGAPFDTAAAAGALRNMYGLAGSVTALDPAGRITLAAFPFCALTPPAVADDPDAAADPALCAAPGGRRRAAGRCYNATALARRFACAGSHRFAVWAFGPPRNVSVRPAAAAPPPRALTPFNSVIGGVVVTQYNRRAVPCPHLNSESISTLTGQFTCQASAQADGPFGADPAFLSTSPLYAGRLAPADFYTPGELSPSTGRPYAFFPHQWDRGGPKAEALVSPESAGLYKLFFDARLSAGQARRLVKYMRNGGFLNGRTEWIEVEIVTYNADFNLFGILTVQFRWNLGGSTLWDYQYNTALLSPYAGLRGSASLALDVVFGAMLLADVVRELREMRHGLLRGDLFRQYLCRFWNWVAWLQYGLLAAGLAFWSVYNSYIAAIEFQASYPVLLDLDAPARSFATDPRGELALLDFTIKMRRLSELKNLWTALSCSSILLFVLRFLQMLDFQPRMSLITRTLRLASVDLGHYLTLFSIILIGYATIGTVLLGERLKQFQTFGDSCAALFMILMAWEPQTMYLTMSGVTSQAKIGATIVTFQIFFWSWVLVATFIMLNIVLAIIVEAFAAIKAGLKDAPTITAESASVCRQTARILANRLLGHEWLISDAELEAVLLAHDRRFSSLTRPTDGLLRSTTRLHQTARSRTIRIPGGLQVSDKDLEGLLSGQPCSQRQSVAQRFKAVMRKPKRPAPPPRVRKMSRRFSMTSFRSTQEDGIEIAEDVDLVPSVRVADLIQRYGEEVKDGQDDEEMLRMMQAENMKREMALFATQDQIRENVETVVQTLDSLAEAVLPGDGGERLRQARADARAAKKMAQLHDGKRSLKDCVFEGKLRVTVVSAKRLPKLDLFSESDPYCVLMLEEKAPFRGSSRKVLAATDARVNDPNPIWNSEHTFSLRCAADTALVAAVLDRDDLGTDDMIGSVRIAIADLPVCEEVDRWYRMRNDSAPNLTRRALIRLRLCLVPSRAEEDGKSGEMGFSLERSCSQTRTQSSPLRDSWPLAAGGQEREMVSRALEITLVSARNLPKRGRLLSKLSLCDPYAQLALGKTEFVSVVRKNTYSPDWGQSFTFDLGFATTIPDPLRVTLMDWNKYTQHDTLGSFEIPSEQLEEILYSSSESTHTFPIVNNGCNVLGYGGNVAHATLSFRMVLRRTGSASRIENDLHLLELSLPGVNAEGEVDNKGVLEEMDRASPSSRGSRRSIYRACASLEPASTLACEDQYLNPEDVSVSSVLDNDRSFRSLSENGRFPSQRSAKSITAASLYVDRLMTKESGAKSNNRRPLRHLPKSPDISVHPEYHA